MKAQKGFTLVEILIVVVILGILAAIVVPQFTQASTEAKTNSLCSNLQSMRSQIELYKVQHNDTAPAQATFEDQMIYCTDINGNIEGGGSKARNAAAGFIYGPYLERIPQNPFNNLATLGDFGTVDNSVGWGYNEATGEIHAADGGTTAGGTAHADL
ncbi:type II secretion system protein [Anaerobaca lacustris]|uniref:Prepilin-type N-terminal cleavage/methylation domain-containing protein n=1 Tax=Anaerobaca lacustris TaxID=3044600 RepID=A0AAW6TVN1_9BACT|nr:prepilin-type N-terminal cleavage/methylation domain-containing protein [Sedimentisphaerales bacterium M17dextr]